MTLPFQSRGYFFLNAWLVFCGCVYFCVDPMVSGTWDVELVAERDFEDSSCKEGQKKDIEVGTHGVLTIDSRSDCEYLALDLLVDRPVFNVSLQCRRFPTRGPPHFIFSFC